MPNRACGKDDGERIGEDSDEFDFGAREWNKVRRLNVPRCSDLDLLEALQHFVELIKTDSPVRKRDLKLSLKELWAAVKE